MQVLAFNIALHCLYHGCKTKVAIFLNQTIVTGTSTVASQVQIINSQIIVTG